MEEGGIGIRRIALIQDCLHGKLTWQVLPGVRYGRNLPDPNFIVKEFSSTSIIALLFGNPLSDTYPVFLNYRNGLLAVEISVFGATTRLDRLYMAILCVTSECL